MTFLTFIISFFHYTIKRLPLCVLFFTSIITAQEIQTTRISKTPLEADRFIGVDDFDHIYYIHNAVFYKKGPENTLLYTNLQLGTIGDIDILNPLEITVFYPDFNTVIKLDNTLNEIIKIDFNQLQQFRTVQYTTTANDKNLWIFNTDLQQLELFNYQTREITPINQPLNQEVITQKSDYNFCRLLTRKTLLTYNIYGSLLSVTPAEGYETFSQSGNHTILKKQHRLFYRKEGSSRIMSLKISDIHVKDFYITANNLYIYDGKNVHHYQLNFSKKE